jgi:hypothetical protein
VVCLDPRAESERIFVGLAFDGLDVFADRCVFFGFAVRRLPESAGRLARALLLATLLAFAGTFVFADLLNLSLLTGVQLWRAMAGALVGDSQLAVSVAV